ncbi:MAG: glutamate--cysteine ligase [Pseudomonadota bacterium]
MSQQTAYLSFIETHQLHTLFTHIQCGIEKESLRITAPGELAQTPHPKALGSTLTHPSITTDYSESLMELITGVHNTAESCLSELESVHRCVYQALDNEILWVASMPCFIAKESDIPIAQYGSSNIGRMKHVYRIGLEKRYGRLMQTIAGIHYNFSLDDDFWTRYQQDSNDTRPLTEFKTEHYFHLIRNFQRHAWLLVYLFGASPAVCTSFVRNREHQLQTLDNGDLGMPFGICLRMGDLGYQSDAQKTLTATYKNVDSYTQILLNALTTEHSDYADIGTHDESGWVQLNTHMLQIENEFYSIIRPKTLTQSGEAPLNALNDRGIDYIEVRCLDLNPYLPMGIDAQQIHFINAFLLFCLFSPSPELSQDELALSRKKFKRVVTHGLQPDLELPDGPFLTQANALMRGISDFSKLLDEAHSDNKHSDALAAQQAKLDDSRLTPAAQILADLHPSNGDTKHFFTWNLNRSRETAVHFQNAQMSDEERAAFVAQASVSFDKQRQIELDDELDFDAFLSHYYAQYEQLRT